MSWETRRNGQRYYYRAQRQGPRIVKQYAGPQQRGTLAAEQDAAARQARQQQLQQRRAEWHLVRDLAQGLNALADFLRPVLTAELLTAGWTLRNREWSLPPCLNKK